MKKMTKQQSEQLQIIDTLLEQDEMSQEALELLYEFTENNPDLVDGWLMLGTLAQMREDIITVWMACWELFRLSPNSLEYLHDIILASARLDMMFYAKVLAEQYLRKSSPIDSNYTNIQTIKSICEETILEKIQKGVFPPNYRHSQIALYEETLMLCAIGRWEQTMPLALKLVKQVADFPRAWELLILNYIQYGKLEQALETCETLFRLQPKSPAGIRLQVECLVKLGREEEAKAVLDGLDLSLVTLEDMVKVLGSYAYTEQHELLIKAVKYFTEHLKLKEKDHELLILHWLRVATLKLGKLTTSKKYLRQMIAWDKIEDIPDYMFDIEPAYLYIDNWAGWACYKRLSTILDGYADDEISDEEAREKLQILFTEYPHFISLIPMILARGGTHTVEFIAELSVVYPMPQLLEFVQGTQGTDTDRLLILESLYASQVISNGVTTTIYLEGKPTECYFYKFEFDHDYKPDPDATTQRLIKQISQDIAKKKYHSARERTTQALTKFPDHRVILHYDVVLGNALGDEISAEKSFKKLTELYPDYFFTQIEVISKLIGQNLLDEAGRLLHQLAKARILQYGELKALAVQFTLYELARNNFMMVDYWFEYLQEVFIEDIPQAWLDNIQNQVALKQKAIRLAQKKGQPKGKKAKP